MSNSNLVSKRKLSGKVAIVTASTEGIGLSIAKRLAEDGANVVVSSRNREKVEKAVEDLKKFGLNVSGTVCHAGNEKERKSLIEFTLKQYGEIDILVSNAAVNPALCPVFDTSSEAWDKIFDVNVKSAFLLSQEVLPYLKKRGGGNIIYVSTAAVYHPIPTMGAYTVSKTALLGLTKAAAIQCAPMNIRVNCVCPGLIETKFSKCLVNSPKTMVNFSHNVLMNRLGKSDECAGIISFLCSDDASYITGESFVVAGGIRTRL